MTLCWLCNSLADNICLELSSQWTELLSPSSVSSPVLLVLTSVLLFELWVIVDSDTVRSVTLPVTSSEVKMSVVEEIREQRSSSAPRLLLSRDMRPGEERELNQWEDDTTPIIARLTYQESLCDPRHRDGIRHTVLLVLPGQNIYRNFLLVSPPQIVILKTRGSDCRTLLVSALTLRLLLCWVLLLPMVFCLLRAAALCWFLVR